jgi:hypothetical protein
VSSFPRTAFGNHLPETRMQLQGMSKFSEDSWISVLAQEVHVGDVTMGVSRPVLVTADYRQATPVTGQQRIVPCGKFNI